MEILEIIIEAIFSPFSCILRLFSVGKNTLFSSLAKPIIIIAIAIVITAILILYFYREAIF